MKNKLMMLLLFVFVGCKNEKELFPCLETIKEYDLGTIKVGENIDKEILLKNCSQNENLLIKQIKTSCGCTVASIFDTIVKAGRTTKIKVDFKAEKESVGQFNKSIVIEANTYPNFTVLYLKGKIIE